MQNADNNLEYIHSKGYEILKFLDKVCKEQNFRYFLAFGTLLGAVRHKGFIPWDDDIDIWMPRNDFMKLFEHLKENNDDPRFKLNIGEYRPEGERPTCFQMRIMDTDSSITRVYANKTINSHLWIDIFALDNLVIEKKRSYLKRFKRRLFMYKVARCKTFYISGQGLYSKMNRLIYVLHNKLGFFKRTLNEEKKIEKAYKALTIYQNSKKSKHCFTYAAVYLDRPHKCIYESSWFENTEDMLFQDRKFPVPAHYDEILTTLYGDYMKIPEEHERHTHAVEMSEESNTQGTESLRIE